MDQTATATKPKMIGSGISLTPEQMAIVREAQKHYRQPSIAGAMRCIIEDWAAARDNATTTQPVTQ